MTISVGLDRMVSCHYCADNVPFEFIRWRCTFPDQHVIPVCSKCEQKMIEDMKKELAYRIFMQKGHKRFTS